MRLRGPLLPALLASLAFVAAGCQPSGGSGPRNTGRLVDPVIAGLAWATATQSGVTAADGSFQYLAGETVRFSLGPIPLGSAVPATASMSVFDLVPAATPPTAAADLRRLRSQSQSVVVDTDLLPVFEASNMLAMLYWFDADKEAGNGIQLPPGLDFVLQGLSPSFRQASARFQARETRLRIAVFRAFGRGLLASARRIQPFAALDRHWAARGVRPQLWTDAREATDADNDGTVDSIRTWTVDARGFRIDAARDNDANGTRDRYETFEFTDHGELLVTTSDNDGNGTVDRRAIREFDANGQLVAELIDTDGDGSPDSIARFVYDADGNLVRREFDDDADGATDRIQRATFDAEGNQLRFEYDNDANGTVDRVETRTYDERHNVLTHLTDFDGDGVTDRSDRSEYDAAGNTTLLEIDDDADGIVDFREQYTWSGSGDLLVEATDNDGDGTADEIVRREYDQRHRTTRYERDQGGNGSVEEVNTFTYVDDAFGNQVLSEQDQGNDGTVDYRLLQNWGAEGQRAGILIDGNGDGLYDLSVTYEQARTTLLGTLGNA